MNSKMVGREKVKDPTGHELEGLAMWMVKALSLDRCVSEKVTVSQS